MKMINKLGYIIIGIALTLTYYWFGWELSFLLSCLVIGDRLEKLK